LHIADSTEKPQEFSEISQRFSGIPENPTTCKKIPREITRDLIPASDFDPKLLLFTRGTPEISRNQPKRIRGDAEMTGKGIPVI
jgi:hypothetical protein